MFGVLCSFFMVFFHSCTDRPELENYLYAEVAAYTFEPDGGKLAVKVSCNTEWRSESMNDWIDVVKDGDTLYISTEMNATKEMRSGKVLVSSDAESCEIMIEQMGAGYAGKFADLTDIADAAMSRNGKYILGIQANPQGGSVPVVIDMYSGKRTELTEASGYTSAMSISDDASVAALIDYSNMKSVVFSDGVLLEPQVPDGYKTPMVSAVSSDGSVWVGYAQNISTYGQVPFKWINGEPVVLESPEVSIYGNKSNSSMARGCSADGNIIYGSEWSGGFGLIYWKDEKLYYPSLDLGEKKTVTVNDPNMGTYEAEMMCTVTMDAASCKMTPDGRYIATKYSDVRENADGTVDLPEYPAILDTEEYSILKWTDDVSGEMTAAGMAVTESGLLFGASPATGVTKGYVFSDKGMSALPVSSWFEANEGIYLSDDRMVTQVSETEGNITAYFGYKAVVTPIGKVYVYWYYLPDLK